MQSLVPILIGVAVLVSFFASFLGAKTWRIYNVVLAFFVFLAAVGFWYLASATLAIHQSYRSAANKYEDAIDLREAMIATMDGSSENPPTEALSRLEGNEPQFGGEGFIRSLPEVETAVYKARNRRGRVWENVKSGGASPEGEVTVTIEQPNPHHINVDSVLHVFEQGPATEAKYLGEFQVTATGDGTATLKPTMTLQPAELQAISTSALDWMLYEMMPVDRHDLFEEKSQEEIAALFPADMPNRDQVITEYFKDGNPAEQDDPPERVIAVMENGAPSDVPTDPKVYRRLLRDYEALFHDLHTDFFIVRNRGQQLQSDNRQLDEAIAQANGAIAYRDQEIVKLQSDLARFEKEAEIAAAHYNRVFQVMQKMDARVERLRQETQQLAAQLKEAQFASAQKIEDERASAARSVEGRTASTAPALD